MRVPSDDLDRFLRAVHRRWVAVRIAEATGLGVLAGCVLALFVLPILLWRGEPAMPVALVTTGVAAIAGMIAGILRRPDVMSAAAEADRQLDLSDLLSTALTTRDRPTLDPWTMTVIAMADARCRTLAANAVIVNRLGGRGWGGIGLVSALVLTLGLMSANPRQSRAVARLEDDPSLSDSVSLRSSAKRASPRGAGEPRPRQRSAEGVDRPTEPEGTAAVDATRASDEPPPPHATSAGDHGGGAGLATSPRESRPAAMKLTPSAASSRDDGEGDFAAGGAASAAPDRNEKAWTGSTVTDPPSPRAPPWRSTAWPAARERALNAVRDGTVGDPYRDLVRDYFDPAPN